MSPSLEDHNSKPQTVSSASVDLTASQSGNAQQDKSADVTALPQTQKSSVTSDAAIPAKTAATVPAAPVQKSAKLESQSTPSQPINKEQHNKGGFVHTLTANDGTKAQVYLSKNGAHAGIVFRNEISRGMFACLLIIIALEILETRLVILQA